jgi:uncharacterized membrane protein (DUF2068 family)
MYCSECGQTIGAGQKYCQACGKPVDPGISHPALGQPGLVQTGAAHRDVAKHVHLLGILWIAFGLFRLIPAFGLLTFQRMGFPFVPVGFRNWIWPVAFPFAVVFLAMAALDFLVGWGLLQRARWARVLALVMGVIALIHVPFGTALGIYTLWALLPAEAEAQYRSLSRPL